MVGGGGGGAKEEWGTEARAVSQWLHNYVYFAGVSYQTFVTLVLIKASRQQTGCVGNVSPLMCRRALVGCRAMFPRLCKGRLSRYVDRMRCKSRYVD